MRSTILTSPALLAAVMILSSLAPATAGPEGDFAQPIVTEPAGDDWEFLFSLNGFLPWVEMETAGGSEIDIGGDDILDALEMTAQFTAGVRRGKWGFSTDVFYADLEFDLGRILQSLDYDIWIVTPKLSYRAWEGDWGFVGLEAGARYTWVEISLNAIRGFDESGSQGIWDGLIGLQGRYNLNEKWHIPFHAHIGTGDSDMIAQSYVGFAYALKHVDLALGFKVLYWEFGSNAPLNDQRWFGPEFSARFEF